MLKYHTWAKFKEVVDAKGISIQERDEQGHYFLYAMDGHFRAKYALKKSNPANADQVDYETNYQPTKNLKLRYSTPEPFAAKEVQGKSLFTRCTGASFVVNPGYNDCDFSIPFAAMKFNGIKIINSGVGDSVNLYVLDSPGGLVSGVPNYPLNQFGYSVYMEKDSFDKYSDYDADVFLDMVIRVQYYNAGASQKTIYVNYDIHELKD